jgi:CHAD domain-containing protein
MPQTRERELKFDVDGAWALPDLSGFVPHGGRVEAVTEELDAEYHDTTDLRLRRLRITLRRRTGGHDAGWHLKLPAGVARTEVQSVSRRRTVPRELTARLSGVLGDRDLEPVARLRTVRRLQRLRDADDEVVLEVADDQVEGAAYGSPDRVERWREVEVEVGPAGDEEALAAVATALVGHGARPSDSPSKLTRLLGPPPAAAEIGPLADLLTAYVRTQTTAILLGDIALRHELAEDEVHDTRVAIRRLRSILRTFEPLLTGDLSGFDDDLRWYAGLLGEVRDSDVLQRRLDAEVAALPAADVVGPVRDELRDVLAQRREQAVAHWTRGRRTTRYRHVLATVSGWFDAVPLSPDAPKHTLDRGHQIVRKAERTAGKRLAVAGTSANRLHRARKAAKRLRYTADLMRPAWPKAGSISKRAKKRQSLLGSHQDEVVSIDFLRERGTRVGTGGAHHGFTWGLLTARAEQRAKEVRRQVRRL